MPSLYTVTKAFRANRYIYSRINSHNYCAFTEWPVKQNGNCIFEFFKRKVLNYVASLSLPCILRVLRVLVNINYVSYNKIQRFCLLCSYISKTYRNLWPRVSLFVVCCLPSASVSTATARKKEKPPPANLKKNLLEDDEFNNIQRIFRAYTVDQYGRMWQCELFLIYITKKAKEHNWTKTIQRHLRQDNNDCSVCWKVLELQ